MIIPFMGCEGIRSGLKRNENNVEGAFILIIKFIHKYCQG